MRVTLFGTRSSQSLPGTKHNDFPSCWTHSASKVGLLVQNVNCLLFWF